MDITRRTLLPVIAAATLLLAGCGAGTPATPRTTTITVPAPPATSTSAPSSTTATTPSATPPTSYDQAQAKFAAAQVDDGVKGQFTSPTGNIYCDIGTDASTNGCELKTGRIAPPTASFCPAGGAPDIGRVQFSPQGPIAVCNSDTIAKEGVGVLKYGTISRIQGSPLQCVSESIGMTCVDTSQKKGFFMARDTFRIF